MHVYIYLYADVITPVEHIYSNLKSFDILKKSIYVKF